MWYAECLKSYCNAVDRNFCLLITFFTLAGLVVLAPVSSVRAEADLPVEQRVYESFTAYWENDILQSTDGDYTNGVRFTWSTSSLAPDDPRLPAWSRPWFKHLPGSESGEARAVALSLGQSIYTPEKINRVAPDYNDRPYAGYLYLAASFNNRGPDLKTTFEFQLGVVGPLSFAEETQGFFHDMSGINRAQGWDNQLRNEPILEIIGERQWLLLHAEEDQEVSFDFIPHLGGRFGNVAIQANLGGELRWGWRLPHRFSTCTIRSGCENTSADEGEKIQTAFTLRNCYLFAGVDGRWVIRNIFLDGNTFTDSQSVTRVGLVAELMAGISVQFGVTRLTCAYVYRTREFDTQDRRQGFGAFSLAWIY